MWERQLRASQMCPPSSLSLGGEGGRGTRAPMGWNDRCCDEETHLRGADLGVRGAGGGLETLADSDICSSE